jgi:hypothetical protein
MLPNWEEGVAVARQRFLLSKTFYEFTVEDAVELVRSEAGSRFQGAPPSEADVASMVYLAATYLNSFGRQARSRFASRAKQGGGDLAQFVLDLAGGYLSPHGAKP